MKNRFRTICVATTMAVAVSPLMLAGVSGAATTPKCPNAATNIAKLHASEAKVATNITAIQAKIAAATTAKKTAEVAKLNTRLSALQTKASTLSAKVTAIDTRCGLSL